MLWFTAIPLGIPGEWTWDRSTGEPDLLWNLGGATVAAALFIGYVRQGWRRFEYFTRNALQRIEIAAWLAGLVVVSFTWLWIVQEISPVKNRLGKSAFVLYYASSSGYFTRARYIQPDVSAFLTDFENLMQEGDVLHTGTHPPGLFLAFYGLLAACESSPALCSILDATQPVSFKDALDVIASNSLRRRASRPLLVLDRRVLWLATLVVMFSASLAVIPLYGLLLRTCSIQSAWIGAALWSSLPGVAIFIPKSDVVFPLIGLTILWLWVTAWEHRSLFLAVLAGTVAWMGLMCSLAFLPVLLAAVLLTFGPLLQPSDKTTETSAVDLAIPITGFPIRLRRGLCVIAAAIGFFLPVFLVWHLADVNLIKIWKWNYQNHAGFYQQFDRTYWKWLLVNPLEVAFAAGWPVTLLALMTGINSVTRFIRSQSNPNSRVVAMVVTFVGVWGLLWLSGKNSGEAARLWTLFLPWLVCLATIRLDVVAAEYDHLPKERKRLEWRFIAFMAIQFLVCLLTVTRVSGFQSDSGNAG